MSYISTITVRFRHTPEILERRIVSVKNSIFWPGEKSERRTLLVENGLFSPGEKSEKQTILAEHGIFSPSEKKRKANDFGRKWPFFAWRKK